MKTSENLVLLWKKTKEEKPIFRRTERERERERERDRERNLDDESESRPTFIVDGSITKNTGIPPAYHHEYRYDNNIVGRKNNSCSENEHYKSTTYVVYR